RFGAEDLLDDPLERLAVLELAGLDLAIHVMACVGSDGEDVPLAGRRHDEGRVRREVDARIGKEAAQHGRMRICIVGWRLSSISSRISQKSCSIGNSRTSRWPSIVANDRSSA